MIFAGNVNSWFTFCSAVDATSGVTWIRFQRIFITTCTEPPMTYSRAGFSIPGCSHDQTGQGHGIFSRKRGSAIAATFREVQRRKKSISCRGDIRVSNQQGMFRGTRSARGTGKPVHGKAVTVGISLRSISMRKKGRWARAHALKKQSRQVLNKKSTNRNKDRARHVPCKN